MNGEEGAKSPYIPIALGYVRHLHCEMSKYVAVGMEIESY
jgi:hypothetical protein